MAHSPVDASEIERVAYAESEFQTNLRRLNELIRNGGSLSGREKNCAFLNLKNGSFATVSAVCGLDFPDDGRCHVLVDWDGDGDQDIWTANRTAPQLRFLKNRSDHENHFVACRLEGKTCNRDAIGARVTVNMRDPVGQPMLKALRAGDGFLGQSSKWLSFGLGKELDIESIEVQWPGTMSAERFTGVTVDSYVRLVQGTGKAEVLPRRGTVSLTANQSSLPAASARAQLLLSSRLPAPNLHYKKFGGSPTKLQPGREKATLVNLWASWCLPCLDELRDFARHRQQLEERGIEIVALSIDELDSQPADGVAAQQVLDQLNFPFASGLATTETIACLQSLYDIPFRQHRDMPVPTSFLFDPEGCLVAIFRGAVSPEQVVADLRRSALRGEELIAATLPFPGRWHRVPNEPSPLVVPVFLMDRGLLDTAMEYVEEYDDKLRNNREFGKLLVWIGDANFQRDDNEAALKAYEHALSVDPDNVVLMNNLAWQYAAHPDHAFRDGKKAVEWAQRAAENTQHENTAVLDTLAAAHAENGDFDAAIKTIQAAIALATGKRQEELAKKYEQNLQLYEQGLAQP